MDDKRCNNQKSDISEEMDLEELIHLRQHLAQRESDILCMENDMKRSCSRIGELEEQNTLWREKYERLYDSHKRVQKLNEILEDKLLQMVDKSKSEKGQLTKDIATLSVRLAECKHTVGQLSKENERYKNDMTLAIQLLQCKPDNFVSPKLDSLPVETQSRVSQFVMSKANKSNTSSNSPPGSQNGKNSNDGELNIDINEYEFNISPSLMAKILEDSVKDTVTKHCDSCSCNKSKSNPFTYGEKTYSVATQTLLNGDTKNSLCLNCNNDVNSNRSNLSHHSNSPLASRLINKANTLESPVLIINPPKQELKPRERIVKENDILNDRIKSEDQLKCAGLKQKDIVNKIGDELSIMNNFQIEPTAHHRLCSKTSPSSLKCDNRELTPTKPVEVIDSIVTDTHQRKNSLGSSMSRTSSVAKSTTSTQKSVGPGPRFCSVRLQEGSNNILLDNAEPDTPPIIYKRQKSSDIEINYEVQQCRNVNSQHNEAVTETTLVDVNVEAPTENKTIDTLLNLLKVSTSPLQPQITHTYTSQSSSKDVTSPKENSVSSDNNVDRNISAEVSERKDEIKVFNFDTYERSNIFHDKSTIRQSDILKLHNVENTKIPKDLIVPANEQPQVNDIEGNKIQIENSSLSSEDSTSVLQRRQLRRVAEWVQQNLEQNHNEFDKSERFFKTLNETDLIRAMPHPVSKFSVYTSEANPAPQSSTINMLNSIVKETIFPVETDIPISQSTLRSQWSETNTLANGNDDDRDLTPEDFARMEYNVKKFLLSGVQWAKLGDKINEQAAKQETDI